MASARKAIRHAFCDRLATPLPDGTFRTQAQARIHPSVVTPIDSEELAEDGPQILIYSRMEKSDPAKDFGIQGDATWFERHLVIIAEVFAVGNDNVDDLLDDIAEEIEQAFSAFLIPGHESAKIRLSETDHDVITDQVKQPIWSVGLSWLVTYRSPWRPRATADDGKSTIDAWLNGQ
jgi:hypothetical protein